MLILTVVKTIEGGMPEGTQYKVPDGGRRIIGRGSSAHVRLKAEKASRQHAELIPSDGWWYIKDLGSTNGTKLNGKKVAKPALLRDGDVIRIAKHSFEVKVVPAGELSTDDLQSDAVIYVSPEGIEREIKPKGAAPTQRPKPRKKPTPTPEVTPEATPEATPEPALESSPEPVAEAPREPEPAIAGDDELTVISKSKASKTPEAAEAPAAAEPPQADEPDLASDEAVEEPAEEPEAARPATPPRAKRPTAPSKPTEPIGVSETAEPSDAVAADVPASEAETLDRPIPIAVPKQVDALDKDGSAFGLDVDEMEVVAREQDDAADLPLLEEDDAPVEPIAESSPPVEADEATLSLDYDALEEDAPTPTLPETTSEETSEATPESAPTDTSDAAAEITPEDKPTSVADLAAEAVAALGGSAIGSPKEPAAEQAVADADVAAEEPVAGDAPDAPDASDIEGVVDDEPEQGSAISEVAPNVEAPGAVEAPKAPEAPEAIEAGDDNIADEPVAASDEAPAPPVIRNEPRTHEDALAVGVVEADDAASQADDVVPASPSAAIAWSPSDGGELAVSSTAAVGGVDADPAAAFIIDTGAAQAVSAWLPDDGSEADGSLADPDAIPAAAVDYAVAHEPPHQTTDACGWQPEVWTPGEPVRAAEQVVGASGSDSVAAGAVLTAWSPEPSVTASAKIEADPSVLLPNGRPVKTEAIHDPSLEIDRAARIEWGMPSIRHATVSDPYWYKRLPASRQAAAAGPSSDAAGSRAAGPTAEQGTGIADPVSFLMGEDDESPLGSDRAAAANVLGQSANPTEDIDTDQVSDSASHRSEPEVGAFGGIEVVQEPTDADENADVFYVDADAFPTDVFDDMSDATSPDTPTPHAQAATPLDVDYEEERRSKSDDGTLDDAFVQAREEYLGLVEPAEEQGAQIADDRDLAGGFTNDAVFDDHDYDVDAADVPEGDDGDDIDPSPAGPAGRDGRPAGDAVAMPIEDRRHRGNFGKVVALAVIVILSLAGVAGYMLFGEQIKAWFNGGEDPNGKSLVDAGNGGKTGKTGQGQTGQGNGDGKTGQGTDGNTKKNDGQSNGKTDGKAGGNGGTQTPTPPNPDQQRKQLLADAKDVLDAVNRHLTDAGKPPATDGSTGVAEDDVQKSLAAALAKMRGGDGPSTGTTDTRDTKALLAALKKELREREAMPSPSKAVLDDLASAKSVVFVVDASASLFSTMPRVLHYLEKAMGSLGEQQQFKVVFFQSRAVYPMPRTLAPASDKFRAQIIQYAKDKIKPQGVGDPREAIKDALRDRPELIYLMSDTIASYRPGEINHDDLLAFLKEETKSLGEDGVRISAVQFYADDALETLSTITKTYGGVFTKVNENALDD